MEEFFTLYSYPTNRYCARAEVFLPYSAKRT